VGPVQSTAVFTQAATNTVTNSRNPTQTGTSSAVTTGFVTFTGTTTVTVTNTVTRRYGQREGSGTQIVSATGTGVQTGTASWTVPGTGVGTQTLTLTDTQTGTATGPATVTTTSTVTGTNTRTDTVTVTKTNTITTTTTATQTSVDDGGAPVSCLQDWRNAGTCAQWCLRETQVDRASCRTYLDCYEAHGCGPFSSCAAPAGVCGVNVLGHGTIGKIIADQVYQCLACPGSSPVTSCFGRPNTSPCTDGNACTIGDKCQSNVCVSGPNGC
jgi:hypothetical protein